MNKNCIYQGVALILMANAMMFMGYFLKSSIETGTFQWQQMAPCILVTVAGLIWSSWLFISLQLGGHALEYELQQTRIKLAQALKKPPQTTTVISASAGSQSSRRKPSWKS